jgi:integrase
VTVYREKDRAAWRFKFEYRGTVHKGTTGQLTREDAEAFEEKEKIRVRREAAGLVDPHRDAPAFAHWSGVYLAHKTSSRYKVKRPDQIDFVLRTALKFWGRRPDDPEKIDRDAPYHDLNLADPIEDPEWLDRFEAWMEAQDFSGSHRNHLRTQVSGMYKVAALPIYRKRFGLTAAMNPMLGVPRDRRVRRDVTLTPEQLRRWIAHASYHVRLALAIAALAPKLRLRNVLDLQWKQHLDRELTRIVMGQHKTDVFGEPIVVLVTAQLRAILKDAKARNKGKYVVQYKGRPVRWIRDAVRGAATRAGIPYGRPGGATFHTIRHAVATWLAEMPDITEPMRAALLAHRDIRTTQGYTHMRPVRELAPLERMSGQLPIAALVTQTWKRWSKAKAGTVEALIASDAPPLSPRRQSARSKTFRKSRRGK